LKLSIILPSYNEEKRLANALDELIIFLGQSGYEYEIIVSADGSTDDTEKIASEYAEKCENIFLVTFPERLGKGGGIINASRVATGDVLIIFDADLSVPPEQIHSTLKIMDEEKADIIYGSRNLPGSIIVNSPPWYRKILGKLFNFLFRLLFRIKLHDTQCGYKAIRKKTLDSLRRYLNIEGYAFDIDLAVKAIKHGYKLVEIPVTWCHGEGSKINVLRQAFVMGRDLLIVWFEGKKKELGSIETMESFYQDVPGDVYSRAATSWFLPRRWWHKIKNGALLNAVSPEAISVFDNGFGSGTLFKDLLDRSKDVIGLDIGEGFVSFVHNEYGSEVKLLYSDAGFIPLRDNVLDCIICSEVLEHIPEPSWAISEMHRILKSDGVLLLTTPNISLRWVIVEFLWTHLRREVIEVEHVAFTRRRLRYYLISGGFRILSDRVFMFGCLNFVKAVK
jgi:ubiquinone/menaquinone biosynthesis C-methylase UbiE